MNKTTKGKIEDWYLEKSGKTEFTLEDSMIVNVLTEWEGKRKEILELGETTSSSSDNVHTDIIITDEQLNQVNNLNELSYTSIYMDKDSEWGEIDYEISKIQSRLHHLTNGGLMCKSFIITSKELSVIKRLKEFAISNVPAEYRDKLYMILGKL